jgi:hypothetical protein
MRTLVALWHAFWLSFEIARYQDELQRCCKERTMSRGTILLIVLALVMAAGCSSGLTPEVTAPVEEKPNLVLDDNIKLEYLSAGSMSIVMVKGMVTNKSTSTVGGIEIKFNLFDANGDPIGTELPVSERSTCSGCSLALSMLVYWRGRGEGYEGRACEPLRRLATFAN